MKKILVLLFISFLSVGHAQTTKADNIRKLLELTGSGKVGAQVGGMLIDAFKKIYPKVPDQYWKEFMKEMNPDALIELTVPIYDKHYSDAEILQLIEFYQSPIGKKVTAETPSITLESMEAGKEWGKKMGEKVVKDLKEKGYE